MRFFFCSENRQRSPDTHMAVRAFACLRARMSACEIRRSAGLPARVSGGEIDRQDKKKDKENCVTNRINAAVT